jgi:sortase A
MKNHIGTILIIMGIIIIAIPLVGRYMANQKQKELMADFLEQNVAVVEPSDIEALSESLEWGSDESNQEDLTESVTQIDVSAEVSDPSSPNNLEDAESIKAKPDTVALLEISKIDVKLPVAEGTDLATLKFALGHMPESAPLGTVGNAVVAGHRSHSFGTYFNRLDEVAIGDVIKVTKGGVSYNYEVYETLIVEPDDLSVLRGSSNHKVITLITCYPLYTSTHRLIVHGVIKED